MNSFEEIDIAKNKHENATIASVIPSMLHAIDLLDELKQDSSFSYAENTLQVCGKDIQLLEFPKAKKAVVVMVDGLGAYMMKQSQANMLFLKKQPAHIIQTCIPSTTASAITTLTTSAFPSATNMLGWTVIEPQTKQLLNLINFKGYTKPFSDYQKQKTWFERLAQVGQSSTVVALEKFAGSGLTNVALKGAKFIGANSFEDRVEKTVQANRAGAKLVYTYWGEVDHTGHHLGTQNLQWDSQIQLFDYHMKKLWERLDEDTLIVITADHGMIDITEKDRIYLDNFKYYQQIDKVAGEGRSLHIHLKSAVDRQNFILNLEEFLEDRATILTKENCELFDEKAWEILGDCLILAKKNYLLCARGFHSQAMMDLKGVHGSTTPAEMTIACLYMKGQ